MTLISTGTRNLFLRLTGAETGVFQGQGLGINEKISLYKEINGNFTLTRDLNLMLRVQSMGVISLEEQISKSVVKFCGGGGNISLPSALKLI